MDLWNLFPCRDLQGLGGQPPQQQQTTVVLTALALDSSLQQLSWEASVEPQGLPSNRAKWSRHKAIDPLVQQKFQEIQHWKLMVPTLSPKHMWETEHMMKPVRKEKLINMKLANESQPDFSHMFC